uniref:Uncharacterized protein n=1 Tax=Lactuca sativa TaxID=4236 RepID=A0A9R1XJ75_LACSA|nr:hypothetical protein LSAT_V11C400209260 [Lactuca sativa]
MTRDHYNILDITPSLKKIGLCWSKFWKLATYKKPMTKANIEGFFLLTVSSYPHAWSLNKLTLVEPHPEIDPPVLPCHFEFTPFNQLYRFADEENYQSIRAVVVRCLPSEQGEDPSNRFSRRDIVIVNEEYVNALQTFSKDKTL